jgi:phage N-6-adenine-methyltransferase
MSKNQRNDTETRREGWGTPQDMFDALDSVFNFKVDLCADHRNHKCELYITEGIDLMSPGAEDAIDIFSGEDDYLWINPPYKSRGGTGKYVQRAIDVAGSRGLVCLIPASVGSKWWLDHVWLNFDVFIFPRRFNFEGALGSGSMFDCSICVKWASDDLCDNAELMADLGDLELGTIVEHP